MLTISTAVIALTTTAIASDLPKEGKVNGTFSSVGTFKAMAVGKIFTAGIFDENGIGLGTPPLDHVTYRCIGVYTNLNGVAKAEGRCVNTDPSGDQFFGEFTVDLDSNNNGKGKNVYLGGTGKFEGMGGGHNYVLHGGDFKVSPELTAASTYVQQGIFEGEYKLNK
jgi:hypothetical protein